MFDDISKLVNETFDESQSLNTSLKAKDLRAFFSPDIEEVASQFPNKPGVIFRLEQNSFTFVIRGFATTDILKDMTEIDSRPELYPSLKLIGNEENSLMFYETPTLEMANIVKKTFCNNRFPINEEHIFNVSDPGMSWWVNTSEDSFNLYFKLIGAPSEMNLTKIGPLGDSRVVASCFGKLRPYLENIFSVSLFSSSESSVHIKTDEQSDLFEEFKEIFNADGPMTDFWQYLETLELGKKESDRKEYELSRKFLHELSILRMFWKGVETFVSKKSSFS